MLKNIVIFLTLLIALSSAGVRRDYRKALEANSLWQLEKFVKKWPNKEQSVHVKKLIDSLYFQVAKKTNTIESHRFYLEKMTNKEYQDKALIEIERLEFQRSKNKNTTSSLYHYLELYPNGTYSQNAKDCIEKIEFDKCLTSKTMSDCNAYLQLYPNGIYLNDVQNQIEQILYKRCVKDTSLFSCNVYLTKYPNGKYVKKVKEQKEWKPVSKSYMFWSDKFIAGILKCFRPKSSLVSKNGKIVAADKTIGEVSKELKEAIENENHRSLISYMSIMNQATSKVKLDPDLNNYTDFTRVYSKYLTNFDIIDLLYRSNIDIVKCNTLKSALKFASEHMLIAWKLKSFKKYRLLILPSTVLGAIKFNNGDICIWDIPQNITGLIKSSELKRDGERYIYTGKNKTFKRLFSNKSFSITDDAEFAMHYNLALCLRELNKWDFAWPIANRLNNTGVMTVYFNLRDGISRDVEWCHLDSVNQNLQDAINYSLEKKYYKEFSNYKNSYNDFLMLKVMAPFIKKGDSLNACNQFNDADRYFLACKNILTKILDPSDTKTGFIKALKNSKLYAINSNRAKIYSDIINSKSESNSQKVNFKKLPNQKNMLKNYSSIKSLTKESEEILKKNTPSLLNAKKAHVLATVITPSFRNPRIKFQEINGVPVKINEVCVRAEEVGGKSWTVHSNKFYKLNKSKHINLKGLETLMYISGIYPPYSCRNGRMYITFKGTDINGYEVKVYVNYKLKL